MIKKQRWNHSIFKPLHINGKVLHISHVIKIKGCIHSIKKASHCAWCFYNTEIDGYNHRLGVKNWYFTSSPWMSLPKAIHFQPQWYFHKLLYCCRLPGILPLLKNALLLFQGKPPFFCDRLSLFIFIRVYIYITCINWRFYGHLFYLYDSLIVELQRLIHCNGKALYI